MTDTREAEEKISLARTIVRYKAPYFSTSLASLVCMPMVGIRTMCLTKNLILGYDPEWAVLAKPTVLAADVAHEINHFQRRHLYRGLGLDPRIVNIAGDLAINPDLVAAGWDLADETSDRPAILPKHYNLPEGLSMEEYYALLTQAAQGGSSKNDKALQKLMNDLRNGEGSVGKGACGGIAHGSALTALEQELESIPGAGRTKAEVKSIELRAAKQIKDHITNKGRGVVPASLVRDTEKLQELSRIRWQDVLARVIRTATGQLMMGDLEPSYVRPSRRAMPGSPIIRPSYVTQLPEIAIVRDTSGSMQSQQLSDCVRESYAIVKDLGIDDIWFTDADAAVAMPWQRVRKEFFKTLSTSRGGGGTDFAPAIADAQKLYPRPDLLIYCTDGDGGAGPPPRGMAVVFAIVPSYWNRSPCDWATTVFIEPPVIPES
jgi:predicted metal-dependent peptidase